MSIPETLLRARVGMATPASVVAIIPSYGGPALLRQVLASLATERPLLAEALVVNNARDPEINRTVVDAPVPATVLTPDCNLGTAGGLAFGLREFLARRTASHAWILDDDAVATPGSLERLMTTMLAAGAEAAAPLITDEHGRIFFMPCRTRPRLGNWRRHGLTPEEFVREHGCAPRRWNWAIWASLIVSRRAIKTIGFPRIELWSQFSDIEYTLRLTERFAGVLVPRAVSRHHSPVSSGASFDAKLYAALQNGSYVGVRLRHGRRALRHLPGLIFRYLRHYRWRPRAWRDAIAALWQGAITGQPSGRTAHAQQLARAEAACAQTG